MNLYFFIYCLSTEVWQNLKKTKLGNNTARNFNSSFRPRNYCPYQGSCLTITTTTLILSLVLLLLLLSFSCELSCYYYYFPYHSSFVAIARTVIIIAVVLTLLQLSLSWQLYCYYYNGHHHGRCLAIITLQSLSRQMCPLSS